MNKRLAGSALAVLICAGPATALAETRAAHAEHDLANGNTLQVRRQAAWDGEGNARARRGYAVTDADGNVVRRGHDRAYRTADGERGVAGRREATGADGNVR